MNENLRWLAINAPDWNNNLDRIARGSVGVDWFSSERFPGRIGFSREELQAAREKLSAEAQEAILRQVAPSLLSKETTPEEDEAWAEAERRMDAMNSTYNHWQHLTDDITAYDPPGPTTMPECTFTTPDEDEAWAEAERRMNAIAQNGNDGLHYNPEDVAFVRAGEYTADNIVGAALRHIKDRASSYDSKSGERSMPATVKAFNALTGFSLSAEQGFMFMIILKAARSQNGDFKLDNYEDMAAYGGLMGEEAHRERGE